MLRWVFSFGGLLFKWLGVSSLQEAMDRVVEQLDRIEADQKDFRKRLAVVEGRVEIAVHGIEGMVKARKDMIHADAADPRLPGESAADYARRVFPEAAALVEEAERKVANVETEDPDEEMPESHVSANQGGDPIA